MKIKFISTIGLLILILSISIINVGASSDLLLDGGFENITSNWFTYWPIYNPTSNSQYVAVSTLAGGGQVHLGNNAISVNRQNSTGDYQTLIYQNITGVPGATYRVSFWSYYKQSIANTTLYVKAQDGLTGATTNGQMYADNSAGNIGTWQFRTFDYVMPANKTTLTILFSCKNFIGYIDDITVKRLDPVITLQNKNNETVLTNDYTIIGSTGVASMVGINLNGAPLNTVQTDADGNFNCPITLANGNNAITLVANSISPLLTSPAVTLNVKYDNTINVLLDQRDTTVQLPNFPISGRVIRSANVKIFLNGVEALDFPSVSTTFSGNLTLGVGINEIKAIAYENDVPSSPDIINVTYSAYVLPNLMPDPSFEGATTLSSSAWQGNSLAITISNDPTIAHTGNKAMKINHISSSGTNLIVPINVQNNVNGTLTWWIKTTQAATVVKPTMKVTAAAADAPLIAQSNMTTGNLDVWEQCTLNFNTGSYNQIWIRITFETGCYYIDDFNLTIDQYPTITFNSPSGSVVGNENLNLIGTTDKPFTSVITLNGQQINTKDISSGSFNVPLFLLEGKNTIVLDNTTVTGLNNSVTYIVYYKKLETLSGQLKSGESTVVEISPGTSLTAEINVKNYTSQTQNACIVTAVYDGTTMINLNINNFSINQDTTKTVTTNISIPATATRGNLSVKCILIDSALGSKIYSILKF